MSYKRILLLITSILILQSCEFKEKTSSDNDKEKFEFIDKRDNNTYKYVKIGNDTWFAENLKFKPEKGNYWVYDNDINNLNIYGYLYDYEASEFACPDGWHISTDEEWKRLEKIIGLNDNMTKEETGKWRGTNKAEKLKDNSSKLWKSSNAIMKNEYGFSILPSGFFADKKFRNKKKAAYFFAPSDSDKRKKVSWTRRFWYNKGEIGRFMHKKENGLCIRCVKNKKNVR
jgi:uncharacterized protein (TIGR02145 family)